jgi:hypothetical protein
MACDTDDSDDSTTNSVTMGPSGMRIVNDNQIVTMDAGGIHVQTKGGQDDQETQSVQTTQSVQSIHIQTEQPVETVQVAPANHSDLAFLFLPLLIFLLGLWVILTSAADRSFRKACLPGYEQEAPTNGDDVIDVPYREVK